MVRDAPSREEAEALTLIGGGLEFGNAGTPPYDGSAFAAYQDVVLVAANYRTNVFGFVNSDELPVTGQNLGLPHLFWTQSWQQWEK